VDPREHLRITGGALHRWLVAQTYDALIVGALWFIGLEIIHVPLAPFWALLGGVLQFIPNIGSVIALIGPVFFALASGGWERSLYVLILYAIVVVIDGLVLQPYLMRRMNRVPIWASLLTPIALGILIPFWGVLLSAPLLAVIYAYRAHLARGALAGGSTGPPSPPPRAGADV
jgi:predicted PurR-regulated permease PerM